MNSATATTFFSPEFRYLLEVCREALSRGNPRPAAMMLKSARMEVDLLQRRSAPRAIKVAKGKVRVLAEIVAGFKGQSGHDAASPYATVKARIRRDPLASLKLTDGQASAAREITDIFEALTRGIYGNIRPLLSERVDSSLIDRDPFKAMADALDKAHYQRYRPWAERQGKVIAEITEDGLLIDRLTGVELALDVLIDGASIREIERRFNLRSGALGFKLRAILDDY